MSVTVYSAMFGGFDELRAPVEQDMPVEWVMFTDKPIDAPKPWRVVVEEPRYERPRLAAKYYKCLPWRALTGRYSIWIDANMEIISSSFAREALKDLRNGWALHRHPARDCIYVEAVETLRLARMKYYRQPIPQQVTFYREHYQHPEHAGLYACGVLARDHADESVHAVGVRWLGECERWSLQDQLSFPVITRQLGVLPGIFRHPLLDPETANFGNAWLTIHKHRSRA